MTAPLLFALFAAAASPLPVTVTGACPSAEAVTTALGSALGADARGGGPDAPRVADLGDRFSVAAAGQVQQYADPGRDCEERARAAAVFIALALNPPLAPPPAAPPVVTAPAAPSPASARWLDLGVAARAEGGTAPAFGVELRAAGGWRWWGVEATAGILAPTESEHSSIDVRAQRFPLGLALTARLPISDRLAIAGAAGLSLVPLTVRAQGIEDARAQTRIDSGARLAVALWLRATPRLRPFVDLHAEIFPSPHHLVVDPLGDIGTTGRLWLGAAAGLAFETTPPPRAP